MIRKWARLPLHAESSNVATSCVSEGSSIQSLGHPITNFSEAFLIWKDLNGMRHGVSKTVRYNGDGGGHVAYGSSLHKPLSIPQCTVPRLPIGTMRNKSTSAVFRVLVRVIHIEYNKLEFRTLWNRLLLFK